MLCLPVAVKKVSDTTYTLYKRDKEFYSNEILSIYLRDKLNVKYIANEELEKISSIETTLQTIANKLPNCTFNKDIHNLTTVKKTEYKEIDSAKIDNVCILGFVNPVGGKMLEDYDAIISGSDQIWNLSQDDAPAANLLYYLNFPKKQKSIIFVFCKSGHFLMTLNSC